MFSSIPLFGLPHKVNVINVGAGKDQDDGAGGIIPASGDEVVYAARSCRITRNTGSTKDHPQGNTDDKVWQALVVYSPNMKEGHYVDVGADSVAPPGRYKINWLKHQIDHTGAFHHTSIRFGQS